MMIKNGVLEEIEKQLKTLNNNDNYDYDNDKIFTKSSGFKEIKMYLNNEILLNNAIIKAKQSTRNYAKRQLTWFRNEFFNDFINV